MSAQAIVLDIEGTVCPITFVHDVLFPYALKAAKTEIPKQHFPLVKSSNSDEIVSYLLEFPSEYTVSADKLISHIEYLIKNDVKATYLKSLQGYLWKAGYESGAIKAPLFDDVVSTLKTWSKSMKIYIYSSGSVPAQKLLFKYTESGDLTPLFSGYYDTKNAGPKIESSSYETISKSIGVNSSNIRFFSDNPKEIDAAHAAGWKTTFIVRPGNPDYSNYKAPEHTATKLELP